MDHSPLESKKPLEGRDDFGQSLWERLNKGEIKQSTVRPEIQPPKPCMIEGLTTMDETSVPTTPDAMQTLIGYQHERFWRRMVGGDAKVSKLMAHVLPAKSIGAPCAASGNVSRYEISTDTIHIVVPLESIGDLSVLGPSATSGQSPVWETELIHELVHEHQFKLITTASEEGRALMASDKKGFPGPGHGELFYTAVCACAQRLGGLSPRDLLDRI
jgi:hypothetical protein